MREAVNWAIQSLPTAKQQHAENRGAGARSEHAVLDWSATRVGRESPCIVMPRFGFPHAVGEIGRTACALASGQRRCHVDCAAREMRNRGARVPIPGDARVDRSPTDPLEPQSVIPGPIRGARRCVLGGHDAVICDVLTRARRPRGDYALCRLVDPAAVPLCRT